MQISQKAVATFCAKIHIAGDYNKIQDVCRKYCFEVGLCVALDRTTYIYTGGAEEGVTIGLINYPRFISTTEEIKEKAFNLGSMLMAECYQKSFTIVFSDETVYYYDRDLKV